MPGASLNVWGAKCPICWTVGTQLYGTHIVLYIVQYAICNVQDIVVTGFHGFMQLVQMFDISRTFVCFFVLLGL